MYNNDMQAILTRVEVQKVSSVLVDTPQWKNCTTINNSPIHVKDTCYFMGKT